MAEYKLVSFNVRLNPDRRSPNFAAEFTAQTGRLMENLNKAVEQLPDGPWEIVSHDFAPVGYDLLGTFLLRKD